MSTKIISIVNQKGGVGKTTTAVNLAAVIAIMGKRVLIVDLDSQGNCSSGLGIKQEQRKLNMYHVLSETCAIDEATFSTDIPNLSIVTSNTNLAIVEANISTSNTQELILKNSLVSIRQKYDYILIDCPPALNFLTLNALVASNEVIIPMLCDFYSLEGLSHLLKTIELVEKKMNPTIQIGGILFTMYDKRNKLTELVEKDVRSCLGDLVFNTTIPRNIKLSEAPSHGKAAIIYDYKCAGSMAYIELAKEMISRESQKLKQVIPA